MLPSFDIVELGRYHSLAGHDWEMVPGGEVVEMIWICPGQFHLFGI